MDIARDLETVIAQEKALAFSSFDEAESFVIGSRMREQALERKLPVVIDIRLWDRQLFYCAVPGSAPANGEWARRKFRSVRLYQKCTYRMFLELGGASRVFPPDYGLDPGEYAIAGGAFPICVAGLGAVGCVAVSGLPQRDDHNFVVDALAMHLGMAGQVALLAGDAR